MLYLNVELVFNALYIKQHGNHSGFDLVADDPGDYLGCWPMRVPGTNLLSMFLHIDIIYFLSKDRSRDILNPCPSGLLPHY